jgi:hypothetical protein
VGEGDFLALRILLLVSNLAVVCSQTPAYRFRYELPLLLFLLPPKSSSLLLVLRPLLSYFLATAGVVPLVHGVFPSCSSIGPLDRWISYHLFVLLSTNVVVR